MNADELALLPGLREALKWKPNTPQLENAMTYAWESALKSFIGALEKGHPLVAKCHDGQECSQTTTGCWGKCMRQAFAERDASFAVSHTEPSTDEWDKPLAHSRLVDGAPCYRCGKVITARLSHICDPKLRPKAAPSSIEPKHNPILALSIQGYLDSNRDQSAFAVMAIPLGRAEWQQIVKALSAMGTRKDGDA